MREEYSKLEGGKIENTMPFSPVEEKEESSEDVESDGSSVSSKSEDWPGATDEQHGIKLSRAASKVKICQGKNNNRKWPYKLSEKMFPYLHHGNPS